MLLLLQTNMLVVISMQSFRCLSKWTMSKKTVMHAMTFEIIYFFCLAEQNIWPSFLAYRQIINNSHLNPPLTSFLFLPSLLLFYHSALHFFISSSPSFSHLISYFLCRQYDLQPCQMPHACYLCCGVPVSTSPWPLTHYCNPGVVLWIHMVMLTESPCGTSAAAQNHILH